MATYLSMHIIACLTRQALNQLINTLQADSEVRFIRASASQMAGRLLCEFEAANQDTLLRLLEKHHVTYEWIIRAELTWGEPSATGTPVSEANPVVASPPSSTGQQATAEDNVSGGGEVLGKADAGVETRPATAIPSDVGEDTILHILRTLKDESAWQIISIQRDTHPVVVLLMHDAVLAPPPLDVPMYACEADVMARGITLPLPRLTYDQIVDLIFACARVMVW